MAGSLVGESGYVIVPLSTVYALGSHQVRPCALPSSGNGGAMEINQQMMTGGSFEQF